MESRLSRWCNGSLEAGWLIAILITPLFFNIHSERVFEPDKLALLRSIALVMAAVWLVRFVDRRDWRELGAQRVSRPDSFWHQPLALPILALIIVYGLATLFSVTPRVSFVGSYQRLQGTYTTLSYIVIFALMADGVRSPAQVRRVVNVAIISSIPVGLYGLLQHYGHDPLPWGGNVQARVAGHLGNAIFISAFLILIVPLTLSRVVSAFSSILSDENLSAADILRSSIYIFALALQLLTIYWSGSRGPLIGLGVGLFSFTLILLVSLRDASGVSSTDGRIHNVLWKGLAAPLPVVAAFLLSPLVSRVAGPLAAFVLFFGIVALTVVAIFTLTAIRRGWAWLWLGWILLTVFMAGWLLLFNIPSARLGSLTGESALLQTLEEWRDLPTIGSYGRMLDPTNTTGREKSGRVRVLIWEGVIDLISPHAPLRFPDGSEDPFNWLRPLLGYGPESMYVAYNHFYPAELATVESRNASPDRSHNETFDTLVITGLAGLLAWQALYLSVVHFAFRRLGIIGSRRDSRVLIGLWIGGALSAAALALILAGPIYLGVAVPTGVVLGVVTYLIYYALFGERRQKSDRGHPFAAERLLMNALVAAVLAHYVEIHFGIAISATRLYFFAYVAVIVALGHRLQTAEAIDDTTTETQAAKPDVTAPQPGRMKSARRKRGVPAAPRAPTLSAQWRQLLIPGLLMTLLVGVLGFGFITYALPPGKTITGPSDLSAAEIFHQALLQNTRKEFAEWPFIFAMIILAWLLGWLIFLAEMVKAGEFSLPKPTLDLPAGRSLAAAGLLILLALAGVTVRFLGRAETSVTVLLGRNLALVGAVICGIIAALLLLRRPSAQRSGGVAAAALVVLALPVFLAGGYLPALIMAGGGVALLWLLEDGSWRGGLLTSAALALASLATGLLYIFVHAAVYRAVLFYNGGAGLSTAELRALEAIQTGVLLTTFFGFWLLVLFLLGLAFTGARGSAGTRRSPAPAYASLVLALITVVFLINLTNVRSVQADMVYKRGRPFDEQATRSTQADPAARRDAWDAAIAIYSAAIDRVPREDFYYLFLGRALLERSGLTEDVVERVNLLTEAEQLLLQAQALNPLNTDHTANLARLNTRWYAALGDSDTAERSERVNLAERYYLAALALSPQNSIIRNEYARLVLDIKGDCDQALAIYDESVAIDPYYTQTQLARADAYVTCGAPQPDAERNQYYAEAAAALESALKADPANLRAWIQLAEIYRQLGDFDKALTAVSRARSQSESLAVPSSEIDFLEAQILGGMGDTAAARDLATRALETALPETAAQIEAFLRDLEGE